MTDYCWGDSQTGALPCTFGVRYPEIHAIMHGVPTVNKGWGGAQTADMPYMQLTTHVPAAGERHFHMLCTNDWNSPLTENPASASELALFDMLLGAQVSWLAGTNKAARDNPGWFTGTWRVSTLYDNSFGGVGSRGMTTNTHGDVADVDFTGDVLHLAYTVEDLNSAGIDVYVDEIFIERILCAPPHQIQTTRNNTASVALYRRRGFGAGLHHLRLVAILADTSKAVTIDWLGNGSSGVPTYLLSSPLANVASFPKAAKVHDYNAHKAAIAAQFVADGFGAVSYIDACADVAPSTDLVDGTHMASIAHVKVAKTIPG
jgi:hypothetical protein